MMGMPANTDEMFGKLESMREVITEVNTQFKDPEKTTFVCVCISEFLSLYETERLIQELAQYEIDTNSIIVNQILWPKKSGSNSDCPHCAARWAMQKKYLAEINELYAEDFHVVKMPLLTTEVRGSENIKKCVCIRSNFDQSRTDVGVLQVLGNADPSLRPERVVLYPETTCLQAKSSLKAILSPAVIDRHCCKTSQLWIPNRQFVTPRSYLLPGPRMVLLARCP